MRRQLPLLLLLALLGYHLDGRLQRLLQAPPEQVGVVGENIHQASVSPDGKRVAGVVRDGDQRWSMHLWDLASGEELMKPYPIDHPPATTRCLAWSSDSQKFAVGAARTVYLMDESRRRPRRLAADWLVRELTFADGGELLMARTDENVFIWNTRRGKRLWRLSQAHLLHAALSADGVTLAVGVFEGGVRLYNVPSRRLTYQIEPSWIPVGVQFCDRDSKLAVAFRFPGTRGQDHARLYHVAGARPAGPALLQTELFGYRVDKAGQRLLVRSRDGVSVWNPNTGQMLSSLPVQSRLIDGLSDDGRTVVTLPESGKQLLLWNPDNGRQKAIVGHDHEISRFELSGSWLTVIGNTAAVWRF